ncbi:TBC1 domain family member 12 [Schistosoma japonicum]|nr:TBC1 domain family member 12 [Schistosoma japonicum]
MIVQKSDSKIPSLNSVDLTRSGPTLLKKCLQKAAKTASYSIDFKQTSRNEDKCNIFQHESTSYLILQEKLSYHKSDSLLKMKMYTLESDKRKFSYHGRKQLQKSYTVGTAVSNIEDRQRDLFKIWRYNILTHWKSGYPSKNVRRYFWEGIPSAIRGQVWSLLLGNKLGITRDLFSTCLSQSKRLIELHSIQHSDSFQCETTNHKGSYSVFGFSDNRRHKFNCVVCNFIFSKLNTTSIKREFTRAPTDAEEERVVENSSFRIDPSEFEQTSLTDNRAMNLQSIKSEIIGTFPTLNLFAPGCPYHEKLHDLLLAYIVYQPETGYIPGMSFIAGMALIVMDNTYDAFVLFANVLNKSYHQAFSSKNEEKFLVYFNDFDKLFARCLPRLYTHFKEIGFLTTMFLFDWLFTIFSRILSFETCIRIWDLYFLYEESALFYGALAILKLCEKDLLSSNFDELSSFLSNTTLLYSLTPDILVTSMYSFHHLKRQNSDMKKARQAPSQESLFAAMHHLPSSFSKEDVTHFPFKFTSNYSMPQHSFHGTLKSCPIDHSARSPRSVSDESDGALDIDDQYFQPMSSSKKSLYSKIFISPDNKLDSIVAHDINGRDSGVNNLRHKVNKLSTVKTMRCTNPCLSCHIRSSSLEKSLKNNTHRKLPQFYSAYSLDQSTIYHVTNFRQNIRIPLVIGRTSAEMIP